MSDRRVQVHLGFQLPSSKFAQRGRSRYGLFCGQNGTGLFIPELETRSRFQFDQQVFVEANFVDCCSYFREAIAGQRVSGEESDKLDRFCLSDDPQLAFLNFP